MKILLGVPEYPPYHVGGGGEVFKNLANNYRKLGHEVVVIYGYHLTESYNDKIEEYIDDNGVKFYQIPEIPTPKSIPFLKTVMPPNLRAWLQLKKIIKKEQPDVAHLHGYGFVFINIISNICNQLSIKYIYTLHGAPVTQNKVGGIIKLVYDFYRFFYGNKTLNNAYRVTAVSKYSTTFPEFNNYKKQIYIIHNGIDIDKYVLMSQDFQSEKRTDTLVFLSLGRIEWLKGFQFFIDIIPSLTSRGVNLKYLIAGTDNGLKSYLDKKIIEYKIEKKVLFLGQLNFEEKVKAIINSDYIIIPSLIENYPAVPIEAIILGKTPIANKIGGIPEIIKDKINGFLVDVTNKEQFADNLMQIVRNPIDIKYKKSDYDWVDISSRYLELMR